MITRLTRVKNEVLFNKAVAVIVKIHLNSGVVNGTIVGILDIDVVRNEQRVFRAFLIT